MRISLKTCLRCGVPNFEGPPITGISSSATPAELRTMAVETLESQAIGARKALVYYKGRLEDLEKTLKDIERDKNENSTINTY